MTNFIPIYPLEVVVMPHEELRLHVNEDLYKHLLTDCYAENKPFGIITMLNGHPEEIGTLVEIKEVVDVWEDGKMNILLRGMRIFRTLEILKEITGKLYSGAIVSYPENQEFYNDILSPRILTSVKELTHCLGLEFPWDANNEEKVLSYDMAHLCCMSLEQEHVFLTLLHESQRLEYLRRHLDTILPIARNIQRTQQWQSHKNIFRHLRNGNL